MYIWQPAQNLNCLVLRSSRHFQPIIWTLSDAFFKNIPPFIESALLSFPPSIFPFLFSARLTYFTAAHIRVNDRLEQIHLLRLSLSLFLLCCRVSNFKLPNRKMIGGIVEGAQPVGQEKGNDRPSFFVTHIYFLDQNFWDLL